MSGSLSIKVGACFNLHIAHYLMVNILLQSIKMVCFQTWIEVISEVSIFDFLKQQGQFEKGQTICGCVLEIEN